MHVERVHRGRRVQHRVEGTHDRPGERGEQHAAERRRQEFPDQHRVGLVGVGDLVPVELDRQDPREADQERHQDLEPGAEDGAPLPLGEALRRQGPLDDELVHPPVEELRDPEAAHEDGGPGDFGVVGGEDGVEPVLVLREEPRGPGEHAVVPAERRKAEPEHHPPAGEDRDPLDEVGPDDRPQAAVDGVDARQQADAPDPEQGGGQLRGAGREARTSPRAVRAAGRWR